MEWLLSLAPFLQKFFKAQNPLAAQNALYLQPGVHVQSYKFGAAYDPGSITLLDGMFLIQYKELIVSGSNEVVLEGDAEIVISEF